LPLILFFKIFWPLIWVLNMASMLMLRAIGVNLAAGESQKHTEEELRLILAESADGGELSRRERLMMENVLDLENKVARQVMVPRRDIILLNTRKPLEENLRIVTESRHTRFPLCDGELDRLVGMVHSKDLLREISQGETVSLVEIARKLPFFPETMRLDVLLREFQRNRTHVAMIVDEYGTVSGMVTFENVLEELVGPIQDEFDREMPLIARRADGRFLVDGVCPVADLTDECGVRLPDLVDADTVGGLVIELLGHIPNEGERVRLGRHELTVTQAEPTRVRRVEVRAVDSGSVGDDGTESDRPSTSDEEQEPTGRAV
jgi:CBS domain containing-hemolysin-like protein